MGIGARRRVRHIPALAAPAILHYPYRVWMLAGHCLGWVNSRIILTLLSYVVFTPVAVLLRFVKHDPMKRTFEPRLDTYRVVKDPRPAARNFGCCRSSLSWRGSADSLCLAKAPS